MLNYNFKYDNVFGEAGWIAKLQLDWNDNNKQKWKVTVLDGQIRLKIEQRGKFVNHPIVVTDCKS